jgi:hypothetical protein
MPRLLTLCFIAVLTTACSSIKVEDYRDYQPTLQPETFFEGYLTAHGVIKNRGGRVIRTFNADIDASWDNGVGTLVEDFIFDDGEAQQRIWTLRPTGDGRYSGTAGDVIGAGELQLAGNSLFLDYVLRIPYGDSTVDVRVDDRMYLVGPNVLINESSMKKFGVQVGSIDLVILRQEGERPTAP